MQRTMEGAEMLGDQIGNFLGTSILAGAAVSLDSYLSSPTKAAILAFGMVLWLSSTFSRDIAPRILFLQLMKLCALFGLLWYSMHARHGLTVCWGTYLLFERMIRQFIVYLKTEGPPSDELTLYMRMKYLVLAYAGTAIVIVNFWTTTILIYRLICITFFPGLCISVAVGILLYWESDRNSRRMRDMATSVFADFLLYGHQAALYIWDRYEMLEGMILFWLPRWVSIPCEWMERRWVEGKGIQRFEYSSCPIDESKNEIRLLRVKKHGVFSGLLKAELVSASIHNPPPYEALSYCWGRATEKKVILLNGKQFHCFPSAYALLYARSSWFHEQLLWVDAICINQDDLIERSKQVKMMRKIYENATRVIVWPGDSCRSRLGSAMLYDLYGTSIMWEGSAQDYEHWFSNELYSPRWLALAKLLKMPYFSRIWVLQEIAVAVDVQVLHGGVYIPWEIMIKVLTDLWHPHRRGLITSTSNPEMRTFHQSSQSDPTQNIWILWLLHEEHGRVPNWKRLRLGKLLSLCSKFESTDARDQVFALVGLAAETTPPLTTIDYEETPAQVYIKSTRNIMCGGSDHFDILSNSGTGYRKKTDNRHTLSDALPSWVPDWSSQHVGFTLASRQDGGGGGYCTSTHTEITIDFHQLVGEPTLEALSLKGVIIDTIDELSGALDTQRESGEISISDYSTTINLWHKDAQDIASRKAKDPYPKDSQSRAEAFWRTIIGDTIHQNRPAPPEFGHIFRKWVELFATIQLGGTRAGLKDMIKRNDPQVEGMAAGLLGKMSAGIGDYSNSLADISVGRRFCVTKDGYMGLVPPETEKNDLLCIIAGAPTPYLLRRFTHSSSKTSPMDLYQLVGECYIHGRMDRVDILEKDMTMLTLV